MGEERGVCVCVGENRVRVGELGLWSEFFSESHPLNNPDSELTKLNNIALLDALNILVNNRKSKNTLLHNILYPTGTSMPVQLKFNFIEAPIYSIKFDKHGEEAFVYEILKIRQFIRKQKVEEKEYVDNLIKNINYTDKEHVLLLRNLIYTLDILSNREAKVFYNYKETKEAEEAKKKEDLQNMRAQFNNDNNEHRFGGKKSKKLPKKEILGKMRCIYKIPGDRKEYLKHKGKLITVKEYKELMKAKKPTKPTKKK